MTRRSRRTPAPPPTDSLETLEPDVYETLAQIITEAVEQLDDVKASGIALLQLAAVYNALVHALDLTESPLEGR